ncbi:hypothetical protein [Microbacterium sp. SORGH_AS_0888]|uniref:hypothetical protein n=1 Tax=Microbacterium sp. SORGH_AS_0888 TaxID=3041791 RepID=UPI00278528F8|nr:hypothetical protein [Microbacterium sp. SORGH_AS_0888]MDQ1130961.1 hypothetical protein [Microbacterium sp. SORGH_AS_0888]
MSKKNKNHSRSRKNPSNRRGSINRHHLIEVAWQKEAAQVASDMLTSFGELWREHFDQQQFAIINREITVVAQSLMETFGGLIWLRGIGWNGTHWELGIEMDARAVWVPIVLKNSLELAQALETSRSAPGLAPSLLSLLQAILCGETGDPADLHEFRADGFRYRHFDHCPTVEDIKGAAA